MASPTRILIIDDDEHIRKALSQHLSGAGYRVVTGGSVGEGLKAFSEQRPAGVILDLKLPDGTGIDVLRELQRLDPGIPVVVVSGHGNVNDAVEAMKVGASEFIEKPIQKERLLGVLERALNPPAPGERSGDDLLEGARYGMIGRSESMRRVYQLLAMAAPTKCRVFISGESGTGKELIAKAIHALSPRRDHAFVELNCAAMPGELIESEMFGHMKGAFTGAHADRKGKFESAHAGTLFLDEIGDMSLLTQAKLLRVLQEGQVTPVGSSENRPVDVRILAATSKNLNEEIGRGTFREDLYHRINVVTIAVPPLRARREDIPDLAEHFLRLASVENGVRPKKLAPRAVEYLGQLPWKGNVRELRNLMERLVIFAPDDVVSHTDVMEALNLREALPSQDSGPVPLRDARERFERQYILDRLAANKGNLMITAKDLGIERTNLYRKMRQLRIPSGSSRD
jgi:two-component system nitrogen regulation response regulator NtrX